MFSRRVILAGAGALLATAAPSFAAPSFAATPDEPEPDLNLQALIARHTAARGGRDAFYAVHSISMQMDIHNGDKTLWGSYRATVEGQMRTDVFVGGDRVFSGGLDAAGAWEWPQAAAAPRPSDPAAAATARHGLEFNLFGLHKLTERGCTLTLAGREVVDAVNYYVVDVQLPDGLHNFRYISPRNWMVERSRDVRLLPPDAPPGAKVPENLYEEFRAVAGVQTPFAVSQLDVGSVTVLQRAEVTNLRYNAPPEDLHMGRDDPAPTPPAA